MVAERTGALMARTSPAGGASSLVAGEETRSREAGQDAEVAARYLVTPGAAQSSCESGSPGCKEQRFHGSSAFGGEYTLLK
ncbi:hypothetical protein [Granulicella sp. S190]|uniref:hypothetical protein n=1 Tax=Granulicella sp. S190 TaxID=1747226 RepID=UPI00131DD4E9|nr:hypothetical protein [Granulicella sp. S190]